MEKKITLELGKFEVYFLKTLLEGGMRITDSKSQQDVFASILSKLNK